MSGYRKPLTDKELIVLLESDISDVDDPGLVSDEENDCSNETEFQGFSNDDVVAEVPREFNVIINSDSDDDTPLSVRLENQQSQMRELHIPIQQRKDCCWRHRNMERVNTQCDVSLSEPPLENLTPLDYFTMFVDDQIIENLVQQTNLYSTQKDGHSAIKPEELQIAAEDLFTDEPTASTSTSSDGPSTGISSEPPAKVQRTQRAITEFVSRPVTV
ncbi:hypothetical protein C0J52_10484 [Blattella germanica]|nr:hypothetical protein C0J52_10484 [Blattella germanica]